jgi:putative Holliday junction resolvase
LVKSQRREPGFTRILGIDYGTQRLGLSLSDPLGIIAQPRGTLKNDRTLMDNLKRIIEAEEISLLVIGLPMNLKGQKGRMAQEVMDFIQRIKEHISIDVVEWDERFTTSIAQKTLIELGTKKKDRRTNKLQIDAMAASVMLQSFLDSTKKSTCC